VTRDEALVSLATAIVDADRARRFDDAENLAALERQVVILRYTLARLDYPPDEQATARG
jgi:hypothetical protein